LINPHTDRTDENKYRNTFFASFTIRKTEKFFFLSLEGMLYRIVIIPGFYYLEVGGGGYREVFDIEDYL
jgi:hypothetical protein